MVPHYYQDDLVTLYHGDCREIDAWLAADVLITDPPYGIAWKGSAYNGAKGHDGIANDGDLGARDDVLEMWGPARHAVVFGAPTMPPPSGPGRCSCGTSPMTRASSARWPDGAVTGKRSTSSEPTGAAPLLAARGSSRRIGACPRTSRSATRTPSLPSC